MRIHDISIRLAGVVLGIVALAAVGCGGKEVQVENQGRLCVFPSSNAGQNGFGPLDPTPRQYVAGEPLQLSVVFPLCLSSSCSTDRQASCTAAQSGNTFAVTAKGSYHEAGSGACTADCGTLAPSCETPMLSEGTFTFQYAGGSVDLVVPSTVAPPCVGTAFGS
jgi:hypothetical protein